jgi:hypothetical protein
VNAREYERVNSDVSLRSSGHAAHQSVVSRVLRQFELSGTVGGFEVENEALSGYSKSVSWQGKMNPKRAKQREQQGVRISAPSQSGR